MRGQIGDERRILRGSEEVFARAHAFAVKFGCDVEHRPAFRDGDGVNKDSTLGELPKNFARSDRMIEIIFTRLHRGANMPEAKESEGQAVANYVVVAQDSGDVPARGAVRNIHENFFWAMTAIRPADLRIEPACARADCRDDQQEPVGRVAALPVIPSRP